MGSINDAFKIYECECGKKFIPTVHWAYKLRTNYGRNIKYYCSYTCYRKAGGDSGVVESAKRRMDSM